MTAYRLKYQKNRINRARAFRRNMTDAGRKLWSRLRNNRMGIHFRRVVTQGPYYCHFLCVKKSLVIEVNRNQYYTEKSLLYDHKRDLFLKIKGFIVLRFSDNDVLTNINGVMQTIYEQIHKNENSPHPARPNKLVFFRSFGRARSTESIGRAASGQATL